MFDTIRVAAISFEPWKWHKPENTERFVDLCRTAATTGAQLIVGPESTLDGYVTGDAIDCPELRPRALALAEPLEGAFLGAVRALAAELAVCIVLGFLERTGPDTAHNAAVLIDPRGAIAGHYHKMQFGEGYEPDWSFCRLGKTVRAFESPLGRCGLLICHDRRSLQLARALVLDGARFLCIPTHGNRRPEQDRFVLARARENGVPIVQANVGQTLIVSRGEVVARDQGYDLITVADMDVPWPPGEAAARRVEQAFLDARPDYLREQLAVYNEPARVAQRGRERTQQRPPQWGAATIRDHTRQS